MFGLAPGPGKAFADGYYVMIEPLQSGTTHEFVFGGGASAFEFTTSVTSTIASVPNPGVLPLLGAGLVALIGFRARMKRYG